LFGRDEERTTVRDDEIVTDQRRGGTGSAAPLYGGSDSGSDSGGSDAGGADAGGGGFDAGGADAGGG
jgi:hypothetical protein